jgi:hypothetical protein
VMETTVGANCCGMQPRKEKPPSEPGGSDASARRSAEEGEPARAQNTPGRALDRAHRGVSGGVVGTDLSAHPTAHCCPKS